MKILVGHDKEIAERFLKEAAKEALHSTCQRARCGVVIVHNYTIIGRGCNSPPGNLEEQRRCLEDKANLHPKVTDKTCCVHAEQRGIYDAALNKPNKLPMSDLYFARLDKFGRIEICGPPYCTHCSKLTLDVEISRFILPQKEGICAYSAREYNLISFQFKGEDTSLT